MKKILSIIITIALLLSILPYSTSNVKAVTEKQKTVVAYDISLEYILDDFAIWNTCDRVTKAGDTGGYYYNGEYAGHYGISDPTFNKESGSGFYIYKFVYIDDVYEKENAPQSIEVGYTREPDFYILPDGQKYEAHLDCDFSEKADYIENAGFGVTGESFGPIARAETFKVYSDKTQKNSVEYLMKDLSNEVYTYKAHKGDDGNNYNLAVRATGVDVNNLEPVMETTGEDEDNNNSDDSTGSTSVKSIKLTKTSFEYNGKTQKPGVVITNSIGKKLIQGVDYSLSNPGGKAIGEYKVKITYKGDYKKTSSKTLTYKIVPTGTSIKSLKKAKKAFTVKWHRQKVQTTGYEIQYSTSSTLKKAVSIKVASPKTVSRTIGNLKAKTKYYVRIRTYKTVNGKTYYSSWSASKNVTTKK